MNLYKILGVEQSASKEEIKQSYKKLAKMHHPDKGGSSETFQEIQHAYIILKDDNKREYYDKTGNEQPKTDVFEARFAQFVAQYYMDMLKGCPDLKTYDIAKQIQEITKSCIGQAEAQQDKLRKENEKVNKLFIAHTRLESESDDLLKRIIKNQITGELITIQDKLKYFNNELLFLKRVYDIVKSYTYKYESKPSRQLGQSGVSYTRSILDEIFPTNS